MNGAQWLVHALQEQGVDTVFGYPGGAIMPVYDALYDGGVRHVLCRHEQGAAIAAIGYARASGKMGVCIATSGPGATNLITGLADALLDSVPVVAITGQVAGSLIGTDAFQEVDVLGLSLACTKHSYLVHSAEELPQVLNEAFRLASDGRPGPVLVDIPKDIQQGEVQQPDQQQADVQQVEPQHITPQHIVPQQSNLPQADVQQDTIRQWHSPFVASGKAHRLETQQLALARQLLAKAKRPVLYVGGGVGMAKAVPALAAFLSVSQAPVVVTLKGLGAVPASYPWYAGMLGMHGAPAANHCVQQCDVLIAVGARFDDRVTGHLASFAPQAKVIHLDIDPAEFNKLRRAEVTLQGDLSLLLNGLCQPLAIDDWRQTVSGLMAQYRWRYDHPGSAIYAPLLLQQLSAMQPADCVVTTDVGQHQMWTAQHMAFARPENFITSSGLGTMGFGLPAAIGAQLARPAATVLCISGDGSFMMNVQELATIKRLQLPIKMILLDNQRLGMVRQWQQLFFDQRYSETYLLDNPDFVALAQAFGIAGQRIERKDQVVAALETLLCHESAYLLHVAIDEMENVWPLVPPGASNSQMLEKLS